jgi:hypothetical protein
MNRNRLLFHKKMKAVFSSKSSGLWNDWAHYFNKFVTKRALY